MKKTFCILGIVITLGGLPALAAPRDDSPRGPVDRVIQRIVSVAKRLLQITPQDEIAVPRP